MVERELVVLAEPWEQLPDSSSVADIRRATESAKIAGLRVYSIPPEFDNCTADEAIDQLHIVDGVVVWIGYIPSVQRYIELSKALRKKGIRLINSITEHLFVMEMDRYLPYISDLTPKSLVVRSIDECRSVEFPVFVKGSVQSRKARGYKACVADNIEELEERIRVLLELENRSRGKIIVRELVKLKRTNIRADGFPAGREYRVFLYRGQVLSIGYYWDNEDFLKDSERNEIIKLSEEAARRCAVPYMVVDVGQLEDNKWIIIEVGDASFAGFSKNEPLVVWNKLKQRIEEE